MARTDARARKRHAARLRALYLAYGDDSLRQLAEKIEREAPRPIHVGRPPGTGRHVQADDRAMVLIAQRLVAGTVESATGAMRQLFEAGAVTGHSQEAAVRRLQRRWQHCADAELAAARDAERQKLGQKVGNLSRFTPQFDAPIFNSTEVPDVEHDHEVDSRQGHGRNSEPSFRRRLSRRS